MSITDVPKNLIVTLDELASNMLIDIPEFKKLDIHQAISTLVYNNYFIYDKKRNKIFIDSKPNTYPYISDSIAQFILKNCKKYEYIFFTRDKLEEMILSILPIERRKTIKDLIYLLDHYE